MENLIRMLSLPFELLQREFTIFGYTFSFWQVMILSCLASIVGYVINKIFE